MKTILLVGNGSEELLRLEETLNRYDHSVTRSSEDLSEVCRISNGSRVALIIADCRRMDENGLEFFSELRQRMPAMPVILLTAHGIMTYSLTAQGRGANTYIVKQVKAGNLERIVTAILTGSRAAVV